ncbi:MAG: helicase-associated domain-containing protein [Anaerolineae bacterium]|nr:helicase-associated domain-containing protein [Anaerolineae bacterium]
MTREALKDTLNIYHMNTLREMAGYLSLDLSAMGGRKADLIRTLDKRIQEIAGSKNFIQELSAVEKALLGWLIEHDGVGTLGEVTFALLFAGLVYTEGIASTRDLPRTRDVLLGLMRRGLVMDLSTPDNFNTRRTFANLSIFGLAPEVHRVLPRNLLPPPRARALPALTETPVRIDGSEPAQFLRQLFFIWSELRNQPAKRLKTGGISKRDMRRIASIARLDVDKDHAYLYWLYAMLLVLNLLKEEDDLTVAVDNHASTLFWDGRGSNQLRDVLKQYSALDMPLELNIRELANYYYYSYIQLRSGAEIRARILDVLQQIGGENWIPFSLFATFLCIENPGSLVLPDQILNSLYSNLRWTNMRNRESLDKVLRGLDEQAILTVLRELQSMGVVNLGYAASPATVPSALQMSEVAHAYFTHSKVPEETAEGQIILQPDFQILAMGPVPLRALANLERVAAREKFDESVITYRLTRERAYQAFQRGEMVASIQLFLEEATQQPVPQNVARTLEEWNERYERIVVRREVTILQLDDAVLLDQLLADSVLNRYLHRLDDRTAWAHFKHMPHIEKQLAALELLPAHSHGLQADLPHSLCWHAGRLQSRQPLPSLYVTGTIRRIAEPVGEEWQLTQSTTRAAITAGMTVPDILALLEQMTGEPVALEWEKQLKAWGKHYGDAQVARVTLLRLDEKAIAELRRADRDLSRWLRPLPHATGMVVVGEEHWDAVKTRLAEWGVVVEDAPWW